MKNIYFIFICILYLNGLEAQNTSRIDFVVDMSNEVVSSEGVFIVGNFFNGIPEPLDDNGDGTWVYPGRFTKGDTLFYKFMNGLIQKETIENQSCTIDDNTGNRILIVPDAENTTYTSCYNACVTCDEITTSIIHLAPSIQLKVFPNPMNTGSTVSWETKTGNEFYDLDLIDVTGRERLSYSKIRQGSIYLERKTLQAGIYFLRIRNEFGERGFYKIIISNNN